VPIEDRVIGLDQEIIAEEREAIASWALSAVPRLLSRGDFTLPASHLALLNEMRRINNSVYAWIESNGKYVKTGDMADSVQGMELFDSYVFHVRQVNRGMSVTYERFVQMLYDMGCHRGQVMDKSGGLQWAVRGVKKVS